MEFSTEDKYLIKCLRENMKCGARQLFKYFLTKTGVLVDWKRWSNIRGNELQQRYSCWTYLVVVDLALSAQYLCCQFFFDQRFQSTKTPVFLRKHFKQLPCSMFLIFSQRFDQVCLFLFSASFHHWRIGINWRHYYVIDSKERVTNRWTLFKIFVISVHSAINAEIFVQID